MVRTYTVSLEVEIEVNHNQLGALGDPESAEQIANQLYVGVSSGSLWSEVEEAIQVTRTEVRGIQFLREQTEEEWVDEQL